MLVLGSACKEADEEGAPGVGLLTMRLLEEVSQEEIGKIRKLGYSTWRGVSRFATMPAHYRRDRKTRIFDDEARWGTEVGVQMRREAA